MLAKLFGSDARAKILFTFFLNPEKPFYIRELSRDLNLQVNSVRRELDNLHTLGILLVDEPPEEEGKIAKKGDKKYFRANADFLLFAELKALFQKSQLLESQDFVARIQEICTPEAIYLTGVFTGAINAATDILLVGEIDRRKFLSLLREFETQSGREINYTIMDSLEFQYRKEIADRFINQILKGRCVKVFQEEAEEGKKKKR